MSDQLCGYKHMYLFMLYNLLYLSNKRKKTRTTFTNLCFALYLKGHENKLKISQAQVQFGQRSDSEQLCGKGLGECWSMRN